LGSNRPAATGLCRLHRHEARPMKPLVGRHGSGPEHRTGT
jgi:hypothetical protein